MKLHLKWLGILAVLFFAAQASAGDTPAFKTKKDMMSYAVGVEVAKNFKKQAIEFNPQVLIQGLKDELAGKKLLLSEPELRSLMSDLQSEVRRRMAAKRQAAVVENRMKGAAFLAANKSKKDVVSLKSGVQYEVLKEGSGKKPSATDSVVCNYRGTLIDGTEFDANEAGKPATLKMSSMIPGLKEALLLMPAGSRWKIYIPSELAYGTRGAGADIGPNETLIFEVELLSAK
jgi:FKBP-type peptidyl-prolyl cis-trans isomerase FklB